MINFATIGSGWITDSFIKSAHATGSWKLVSVFSRSQSSADAFAQKHNITGTHTTLESLASDKEVQAVYIASPNSLHFEHAKLILSAGKHVILEKPATSTLAELKELFEAAKANGVFLIEAYRHIQEPNFKVLQAAIKEKLGPVYGASLNYASRSSRYTAVLAGETPNIFSLDYSGGSLVDLGVYPIAAAVALFGAPVSQTYKPFVIRTGADGGGIVVLNYKDFGVSIHASKIYTSAAPSEVFGERGTLRVNGVTDIAGVEWWEAGSKSAEALGGKGVEPALNMQSEAEEFARIIGSGDVKEAERLREISEAVQSVTEDLRRQNGLTFKVEKA